MGISSKKNQKKPDGDSNNLGGIVIFLPIFAFLFFMLGYTVTGEKIEGTEKQKYTFFERLFAGDIYLLSVIFAVLVIIAIVLWICKQKDQANLDFLEGVERQKENLNNFLGLEELKEKGVTPITKFNINIACVVFDNNIHIQWEKLYKIPSGNVVIYRRTGGFAQDRFSKIDNGIRVEDSSENVRVFEDKGNDLVAGTTYNYTVIYEVDDEEKTEHFIARFQPVLEEDSTAIEEEVEKTEVEIHVEKRNIELEKKRIDAEAERIVKGIKIDAEAKDIKGVASYMKAKVIEYREQLKQENPKKTRKQLDEECKIFEKELQVRLDIMESE